MVALAGAAATSAAPEAMAVAMSLRCKFPPGVEVRAGGGAGRYGSNRRPRAKLRPCSSAAAGDPAVERDDRAGQIGARARAQEGRRADEVGGGSDAPER